MSAMEHTNIVIAKVLNLAMENGVSYWSLEFDDLGLDNEYETYFFPCIKWLEAEGIIRVGSYEQTMGGLANGSVENVALTSLGMAALGQEVEIAGKREELANTVRRASEGKVDYHRFADAIGGLLGGFVKSAGG